MARQTPGGPGHRRGRGGRGPRLASAPGTSGGDDGPAGSHHRQGLARAGLGPRLGHGGWCAGGGDDRGVRPGPGRADGPRTPRRATPQRPGTTGPGCDPAGRRTDVSAHRRHHVALWGRAILAPLHFGHHQALRGVAPPGVPFLEARLGRRAMMTRKPLEVIPGAPAGRAGPPGVDHWLCPCRCVASQGRRHLRFEAIERVVPGGGRHAKRLVWGLSGGVHGGVPPEDDFTPQRHPRRIPSLAGRLSLGGPCQQGIKTWRCQEPLQAGPGHDTEGALRDAEGKDRVEQHRGHLHVRSV